MVIIPQGNFNEGHFENVKKMCEKLNLSPDDVDIDFEAKWDSNNTFEENYNKIRKLLNKRADVEDREDIEISKDEVNYYLQKEQERAKNYFDDQLNEKLGEIANSNEIEKLNKLYKDIPKSLKQLHNGHFNLLIISSKGGYGKSFQVKKWLKENIGNKGNKWEMIRGHITPLEFYTELFQNRNKTLVLDDIAKVLKQDKTISMLKSATDDDRIVEYNTTSDKLEVPDTLRVNGNIILILNEVRKSNEDLKALLSRGIEVPIDFTYNEIIQIFYAMSKKDLKIGGEKLDLSKDKKMKVAEWIKDNTDESCIDLNLRTFLKCLNAYKTLDYWKQFSKDYILPLDEKHKLVKKYMEEKTKTKEAVKKFKEKTGMGSSTFYNYKNEIENKKNY